MSKRFYQYSQQPTRTTVFKGSDVGFNSDYSYGGGQWGTFVNFTYNPLISNSNVFIEVFAPYTSNYSAQNNTWTSDIKVNNAEVGYNIQYWQNNTGGGTLSGALFPLAGNFYNLNQPSINIQVAVGRTQGGSTLSVKQSGFFIKITEIGLDNQAFTF